MNLKLCYKKRKIKRKIIYNNNCNKEIQTDKYPRREIYSDDGEQH